MAFSLWFGSPPAEASTTALAGHVPAVVPGMRAIGRLEAGSRLQLSVGLPLRDRPGLRRLLDQIYDPASPRFHQYLTPEAFTGQFGPTADDYRAVTAFIEARGLKILATHPNRLLVDVEGSVSAIEQAFHINLRLYRHPNEPRTFFAPDSEPEIEGALPILHISGLDNYILPRPADLRIRPNNLGGESAPAVGSGPSGSFAGADFRKAYAPGVTLTGAGQSVGLFELVGYYPRDITLYETQFGLTNVPLANVLLDGITDVTDGASTSNGAEPPLDIEMAISMAPGLSQVITYIGHNPNAVLNRMATDNLAKQLSASWTFSVDGETAQIYEEMAAQGQSYFNASGDTGAYTSALPAPLDLSFITVVGGTALSTGNAGVWASETTWNWGGTNGGSGGGISTQSPIPTWQQGIDMVANLGSTSKRNIPDVAAVADNVWIRFNNGAENAVGGTSASSPLWAGFAALVNQQAALGGQPSLGFANPALYAIGKGAGYTSAFHDIKSGNNATSTSRNLFPAVAGYDLCTGWGTPNGSNLITALIAPNDALHVSPSQGFTAVTPFAIPFGPASVSFSITNTLTDSLTWSLVNTSAWLTASATGGVVSNGGPAETVTMSLNTSAIGSLPTGTYYANVLFDDQATGISQVRGFTFIVSGANYPLAVSGFNAGVIVPNDATSAAPQATAFDVLDNDAFYQAGLNGGTRGLPASGLFLSQSDGTTTFGFGPYGSNNVLLLGGGNPGSNTLFLSQTQSFNSIAILSASANGGGIGTCVLSFADGSQTAPIALNAQDWETTSTNAVSMNVDASTNFVAIEGFGRLNLGAWSFDDSDPSNPGLYQTTIDLAASGLNEPVQSISFAKPQAAQDTGVFAVSGALMPPQVQFSLQPQSATNVVPSQAAVFTSVAMGVPPLAYQWYRSVGEGPGNFAVMPGQTNASLTLATPQSADAGAYYVVVTNGISAATSALANLSVFRSPNIVVPPSPAAATLFAGRSFTLSVVADAALPVYYAWNWNGSPIAAATNSAYELTLEPSISGDYTVVVSNSFGSVTSTAASLTVVPDPGYPYGQAVLADKPLGYWPLSETAGITAHDYVAGNDGSYNHVILGQAGDSTLAAHPAARFGSPYGKNSYVGGINASISTAGSAAFSIEVWVSAGPQQPGENGLITRGFGGQEQFCLDCGGPNNAFRFFLRDPSGTAYEASSSVVPNGKWHHLVGVCNQFQSIASLYIDGTNAAHVAISPGTGLLASTNPVVFGSRQSTNAAYDLQLTGFLEEAALYNYALSATQVRTHFTVVTNQAPVFSEDPIPLASAYVGQPYAASLAGLATDPDNGPLIFALVSGPAWMSVATNGALSGTPANADAGTNTFVVSAKDALGLSASAEVIIQVDAGPIFTNNPFYAPSAFAGQPYLAAIAAAAADPDGSPLTFSIVSGPAWLSVDTAGNLFGIPAAPNAGSNAFVLSATDPAGLSNTATMFVYVEGGPVFAANPIIAPAAAVGQPYSVSIANAVYAPNGEQLTFSLSSGPAWLQAATNGVLSGTPQPGNLGLNSFGVLATDPHGLSGAATLTISVQSVGISLSISAQGGGVALSWTGGAPPYQVQMTTGFLNPAWQDIGPPLSTTNLILAPTVAGAFYRVISH